MAAHRYWRLRSRRPTTDSVYLIAELEMRASNGGADETGNVGGTSFGTAGFFSGSEGPDKAFNNNTGNWHQPLNEANNWADVDAITGWDFGSGNDKDIVEVAITINASFLTRCPSVFAIEYSDDNVTYTTLFWVTKETWSGAGPHVFSKSQTTSDGSAPYWAAIDIETDTQDSALGCREIDFFSGGSNITSGGSPVSMPSLGGFPNTNAFDNNTGTLWQAANGLIKGKWVGYHFASAVAVDRMDWTARNDGFHAQSAVAGIMCYSDDGIVWIPSWTFNNTTNYTSGETRTFSKPVVDPEVTSVSPDEGTANGGTAITITGVLLTGATGVLIGGNAATSVVVVNSTTITCVTPAGTIGFADVQVTGITGNPDLAYGFEYLTPVPTVVSVTPDEGTFEGGTAITISGTELNGATAVYINGDPATSFVVVNPTTITCVTPASLVFGFVEVMVYHPYGDIELPYGFEYLPPSILYITPDLGYTGTVVTITGSGFSDATGVLVNGVPADIFFITDAHEIVITIPEQSGEFFGLVDVVVQHPLGDIELPYGFEYQAPLVNVSQIPILIPYLATEAGRVSQIPINIVFVPQKPGRISQVPIEVAFPFEPLPPNALLPQWPIEEVWSWRTTIVKSISGKEQRMAVRREPWQSFAYRLAIFDDADRQTMLYTLWRHSARKINYPLFIYRVNVNTFAATGDIVIDCEVSAGNFREGEAIAIFNADLTFYQVLETAGFTSPDGILLATPLEFDVEAGLMIAPAPLCRIGDENSLSMSTHNGDAEIELLPVATRTLLRPGQNATLDTLDGFVILLEKFVSENVEEQVVRNIQTLSNDISTPRDFPTWYQPQINTERTFIVDEAETLDYWREFADTMKGSRGAFLIPSYRNDFTLNTVPALNQKLMTTTDLYMADYFKSLSNRYLRIETQNGVIFRKVADVILDFDRTATIVLATALGNVAGDNIISKISIVHKVRITDDRIRLLHMPNYVELSINVSTVEK